MRYLLSICALFLLISTLNAQLPKKAEDWQTFSPVSDEFSVETPVFLEQRGDDGANSSRKYYASINGTYIYVFSDPVKTPTYLVTVRDILITLGQPNIFSKETNGSNTVTFKDSFGYWHNLTTLRTESRIYIAQTVTLDEKSDLATRFIRSFALGSRPPLVRSAETATETKNPDGSNLSKGQGSGRGSGSGSGSGAGSGVGSGSGGMSTTSDSALGKTSGLRILTKPRPSYTEMARVYEISGTVIVRVLFKGSGDIGSVTPITQAPFGLTERAIDAARRITFEPAYVNGSPVTISKQIEYSFAIF